MWKKAAITLAVAVPMLSVANGGNTAFAGGGCHQITPGFIDASSTSVTMDECKFLPAVVRIDAGDSIQWTNNDDVPHMVTGVAGSWGNGQVHDTGDTVQFTFDKTGVYPYFCEMHAGMVGAVVVGDGTAASAGTAGDLAVSAEIASAGAPQSAATDSTDHSGFGASAAAISGIAVLLIGGAAILGMLRLTGRLPRV